jgi:hypothetical protein
MEYVAIIKMGKTTLRVPFTGGTITAYGVNPATFSTSNPIFQRAIETSEAYKAGRIVKLTEVALSGTNAIKLEHNPEKQAEAESAKPEASEPEAQTEVATEEGGNEEQAPEEQAEDSEPEAVAEVQSDAELTKVTVTCLEDAALYLKENFGVTNRQVRSKKAAETIAAANGIEFVWDTATAQ